MKGTVIQLATHPAFKNACKTASVELATVTMNSLFKSFIDTCAEAVARRVYEKELENERRKQYV